MAVRTAKGTAKEKTSGDTLTLSDVSMETNSCLLVGVGFDQSQGAPTVTFGNIELSKVRQRLDSTSGIGTALYFKPIIWSGRTADVTATWTTAIGARALCAVQWTGPTIEDIGSNNIQTPNTNANSGFTGTPNYDHCFNWCIHSSAGPVEDTPGTIETDYGYQIGQRDGTTGGGLDVTIQETYRYYPSDAVDSRSRMTGATSRAWVSCLTVLRNHTMLQQGITPSDVHACEDAFESLSLNPMNMVWAFNEALDRWEVFNVTRSSLPSVVAHNNNGWEV